LRTGVFLNRLARGLNPHRAQLFRALQWPTTNDAAIKIAPKRFSFCQCLSAGAQGFSPKR
jgi:hypothetical protein